MERPLAGVLKSRVTTWRGGISDGEEQRGFLAFHYSDASASIDPTRRSPMFASCHGRPIGQVPLGAYASKHNERPGKDLKVYQIGRIEKYV